MMQNETKQEAVMSLAVPASARRWLPLVRVPTHSAPAAHALMWVYAEAGEWCVSVSVGYVGCERLLLLL